MISVCRGFPDLLIGREACNFKKCFWLQWGEVQAKGAVGGGLGFWRVGLSWVAAPWPEPHPMAARNIFKNCTLLDQSKGLGNLYTHLSF